MNRAYVIWLAVDSNGDERISSNSLGFQRFYPGRYHEKEGTPEEWRNEKNKVLSYLDISEFNYDHWIELHDANNTPRTGELPRWMFLPKGTIKRIIGRELTWEDDPVKIENFDS